MYSDILKVNTVHHLSFSRFEELDSSTKTAFITELHETMDEPFSNSSTANELLESFKHKLAYWVLMADETPIGLFGLSLSITFPNQYQTTSFILKNWRGKRLGPLLKNSCSAKLFRETSSAHHLCSRGKHAVHSLSSADVPRADFRKEAFCYKKHARRKLLFACV